MIRFMFRERSVKNILVSHAENHIVVFSRLQDTSLPLKGQAYIQKRTFYKDSDDDKYRTNIG